MARLAGVSEITVSRILRNAGPISDRTRAKVMLAVEPVGYVPNRIAGALASSTSNLMGVIMPSLSNIVFPEVLQGELDPIGASSGVVRVRHLATVARLRP